MADADKVQPLFSTLELVSNDRAAICPEKDLAITAPEHDRTAETAQTAVANGVEVAYDSTLPEVIAKSSSEARNVPSSEPESRKLLGLSRKKFWVLLTVLVLLLISGNVGVGVGVGLRSSKNSHEEETLQGTASPSTTASETAPSLSSFTRTAPLPSGTSFFADNALLNDTSLAACSSSDGNRHVFFQDQSNAIREGIFTFSDGKWSTSASNIVATDAKAHTPMSSFQIPLNLSDADSEAIYLFYIAANNSIVFQLFQYVLSTWSNNPGLIPGLSNLVAAAPGSRALSAIATVNISQSNQASFHLLYEGAKGNLTWALGRWPGYPPRSDTWDWEYLHMAPALGETSLKNSSGPLSLDYTNGIDDSSASVEATYVSYFQDTFDIEYSVHSLDNFGPKNGSQGSYRYSGTFPVHELDFTRDGFFINGSNISSYEWVWTARLNSVPYHRLASISPPNSDHIYIYRQLNQTAISEETFDKSSGFWTVSNISIST